MKYTPTLCLIAAFVLLFSSCKNANKNGLAIPKDAAFVFHINAAALSSKLSWDDIKKTGWYKDLHQQADDNDSLAQKILDNPEASGIDVKSDFVFFVQKKGRGGFGLFEGGIKDAKAFETLVKKMSRAANVEKADGWNMIVPESNTVVAWNDSKFAVINDMPLPDINPLGGSRRMKAPTRFRADSLKIFLKQTMSLDSDESLFDDDRFADVMKDGGDMHMWVNIGSLYSSFGSMLSMLKASTLFEGNVSAVTMNFEAGKIAMRSKQFFNKEMQKVMEKMKAKNVDAALLNRLPSDNLIAVAAMNVDPAGFKEMMKTLGLDGMLNAYLGQQDLSLDDILNATNGEFVVSVADFKLIDTTLTYPAYNGGTPYTYQTTRPDVDVLVASSVNQKASFQQLLTFLPTNEPDFPFTYQLNNDWFAMGTKPATINAFLAGGNKKHPFTDKIAGHPSGFYIDIQRLLKSDFSKNSMVKSLLNESAAVWKDVVAVGNPIKDGVVTSEILINMMDEKTNSLQQLNQFIEKMNATRKKAMVYEQEERSRRMDSMSNDVMTAPMMAPPVIEQRQ